MLVLDRRKLKIISITSLEMLSKKKYSWQYFISRFDILSFLCFDSIWSKRFYIILKPTLTKHSLRICRVQNSLKRMLVQNFNFKIYFPVMSLSIDGVVWYSIIYSAVKISTDDADGAATRTRRADPDATSPENIQGNIIGSNHIY